MPKMTSDLASTVSTPAAPKNSYKIRIVKAELKTSKKQEDGTGGNPMAELTWVIADDRDGRNGYNGKEIRFDNVMLGGKTKDGEGMPLFNLADLLFACRIPWECESTKGGCGFHSDGYQPFIKSDGNDGHKKGSILCPQCKIVIPITYDTDDFIGKTCLGGVNVKKREGSDRKFNTVESYAPID